MTHDYLKYLKKNWNGGFVLIELLVNKYFVDDYKSSFICCLFTYFEKSLEMIQQKHWMFSFLKENWISVYLLYLDSANIFQIYRLKA